MILHPLLLPFLQFLLFSTLRISGIISILNVVKNNSIGIRLEYLSYTEVQYNICGVSL